VLAARIKKLAKSKGKKKDKGQSDITCKNCKRSGHGKPDCYQKEGGKEGQAPWDKNAKAKDIETVVMAANDKDDELFMFTYMTNHAAVADILDVPKLKLGTCIDSRATRDYCPDCSKFSNYKMVQHVITTVDGWLLIGVRMGDLHIELPNGSGKSKLLFKNAIHIPTMAFTLISISRLDKAGFTIMFNKGMCTIKNPKVQTVTTIPHIDGLYKLMAKHPNKVETVNTASGKMSINEAHRRLGHIAHSAVKHAIFKGFITGIELDNDLKLDFCEACTKAKSN
jgi:GAG-pre-integrase domain